MHGSNMAGSSLPHGPRTLGRSRRTRVAAIGAALAVAVGVIPVVASSQAGALVVARAGTTCKATSGTGTFTPPLPGTSSTKKVASTLTLAGIKLTGCVGGGVTSGALTLTLAFVKPQDCETVFGKGAIGVIYHVPAGLEFIDWNNGRTTSGPTGATTVKNSKAKSSYLVLGKVTGGLFEGLTYSSTLTLKISKGEVCPSAPLGATSFQLSKSNIYRAVATTTTTTTTTTPTMMTTMPTSPTTATSSTTSSTTSTTGATTTTQCNNNNNNYNGQCPTTTTVPTSSTTMGSSTTTTGMTTTTASTSSTESSTTSTSSSTTSSTTSTTVAGTSTSCQGNNC